MDNNIKLEICVDSIVSALEAEKGGANRIELCDCLAAGGTTPSAGLMKMAREQIKIDIYAMIRPRSGDFCYTDLEFQVMKENIRIAKEYGIDGIVFGILTPEGYVDTERTKELIEIARPMGITFHRAFDMAKNPEKALQELIQLGVDRILTSGQKNSANEGLQLIKNLVQKSNDKISIMAGSGVNSENVEDIINQTSVKEIHLSAKRKYESTMSYRNENVNMGITGSISEYENYYTDSNIVKDIKERISKINVY